MVMAHMLHAFKYNTLNFTKYYYDILLRHLI